MNRLRALIAAAILGVSVLGLSAGSAAATSPGIYCGSETLGPSGFIQHPGYYYAALWRDGGESGPCIGIDGAFSNLGNYYNWPSPDFYWNDQASSWAIQANNCHYSLAMYANTGYGALIANVHSPASGGFTFYQNDSVSSVKIINNASC